jgi:Fe-S cluster biosynthesis and repair protein YggX
MAKTVQCATLKKELPGIDPQTPDGKQALKMVTLIGGPEFAQRVEQSVSAQAFEMWKEQMLMIMNEFRLDPTSDESNRVLKPYMEAFFFGEQQQIPNYVPPEQQQQE